VLVVFDRLTATDGKEKPGAWHFFTVAQQSLVGQVFLSIQASRTHSDTPHSVGLLYTSDPPHAETSAWLHTTLTRDIHAPAEFEPAIPAGEQPQTHALDRAANGIGGAWYICEKWMQVVHTFGLVSATILRNGRLCGNLFVVTQCVMTFIYTRKCVTGGWW
jgi:hypothetical protein